MKCSNLAFTVTFCMLCTSCSNTSTDSPKNQQFHNRLSEHELDEIRLYAEGFQFKEESNGAIVYAERPNPLAQEAINRAAEIKEKCHLPYAALFVLRLYHENMKRHPRDYHRTVIPNVGVGWTEGNYSLEYEFARIAVPPKSRKDYYDIHVGYDWIRKHKSKFSNYPAISEELSRIEQLRKRLERQREERAAELGLNELERFAMEAPVIPFGYAPAAVPEEINRILEKLRKENRTEHLPYVLEYGLNLHLKNLTRSQLARILPVNDNLMLSELIRLTNIPKYKSAHEAGWLNRQFYGSFEDINGATGYSSYQIYIWYLENWYSVSDMPNIERLYDIQKRIEKTGMQGVGGGQVCHYGCYSLVSKD